MFHCQNTKVSENIGVVKSFYMNFDLQHRPLYQTLKFVIKISTADPVKEGQGN